ncbi:MAG TPA: hypothetical protein VGA55_07670 [Bacteroidota bacterium]
MLEKKVYELLNKEVDGANSPKEKEQLRVILERSAEARRTLEDLRRLTTVLRSAPQIDPPSYLKTKILNSVKPVPGRFSRQPSFAAKVQDFIRPLRFRPAYIFTGGAVAAVALFFLITGTPSDTSTLVGTMGPAPVAGASADFDFPQLQGTVRTDMAGEFAQATISLDSEEAVDLIIEFPESDLQFENFRALDNAGTSLAIHPGELRLTNAGANTVTVTFRMRSTDPVLLKTTVVSQGTIIAQRILTLEQKSIQ